MLQLFPDGVFCLVCILHPCSHLNRYNVLTRRFEIRNTLFRPVPVLTPVLVAPKKWFLREVLFLQSKKKGKSRVLSRGFCLFDSGAVC